MLSGWRHRRKLERLARHSRQDAMTAYLRSGSQLKPDTLANTPMIAVDLELTGLEVERHQIIALGWTLINDGRICIGSNRHLLVQAGHSVGDSAVIHELVDSDVAAGGELDHGLEELFSAAAGRVWIFHHASLDCAFLRKASLQWSGVAAPITCLDTMRIELSQRQRREQVIKNGDLQLGALRLHYHLPEYTAHNALMDAFATAELMLAIAAQLQPRGELKLSPYLRYL